MEVMAQVLQNKIWKFMCACCITRVWKNELWELVEPSSLKLPVFVAVVFMLIQKKIIVGFMHTTQQIGEYDKTQMMFVSCIW